ncbi:hypothetical protein BpHYR1_020516 [Brachionus plicatilis]|uniref:Uncharacterized protein n=1 Tax=Brachionus plicatilis TaxID=10195 RepID=A0A3M7QPU4_BRAPC|nr:hypothetical protein BpHYR1_020516 [Brachionus plicatilis]
MASLKEPYSAATIPLIHHILLQVRKPFSRIFCSTSFSEKLAKTFLTVKLNFKTKKSFCAECFEIVLNGYFFLLKSLNLNAGEKAIHYREKAMTEITTSQETLNVSWHSPNMQTLYRVIYVGN